MLFAIKSLCTLHKARAENSTRLMSHISAFAVKKISRGSGDLTRQTQSTRAQKTNFQLRFEEIFVKFKNKQGMMRTKTAILPSPISRPKTCRSCAKYFERCR